MLSLRFSFGPLANRKLTKLDYKSTRHLSHPKQIEIFVAWMIPMIEQWDKAQFGDIILREEFSD